MLNLTPRQIVAELDQHIVGQDEAKRAVAIAVRNRWRRQQLAEDMREEVPPKNILMIGPTGVGKTEISRRFSKLTESPFIKVEATKYTEVGYYGRDVESMVRELVENAIGLVRAEEFQRVEEDAKKKVEEKILDMIHPWVAPKRDSGKPLQKGKNWRAEAAKESPEMQELYNDENLGFLGDLFDLEEAHNVDHNKSTMTREDILNDPIYQKLQRDLGTRFIPGDAEFTKFMMESMESKLKEGKFQDMFPILMEASKDFIAKKHIEARKTEKMGGKSTLPPLPPSIDALIQSAIQNLKAEGGDSAIFAVPPEDVPDEIREMISKLTGSDDSMFGGISVKISQVGGDDEDDEDDDGDDESDENNENNDDFDTSTDFSDENGENGEKSQAVEELRKAREEHSRKREELREQLRAGILDDRMITVPIRKKAKSPFMMMNISGNDAMDHEMSEMFERFMPQKTVQREMTVKEARKVLTEHESNAMISEEKVNALAVERAENSGIIFIDEIDKIVAAEQTHNADVSRQGVQRDLLPLVEGTTVQTRYGYVKTDHILFIAAGAFHRNKPSDLMPELQGRFPIRVELKDLTEEDFVRILKEPKNSLLRQYEALLKTDGVTVNFQPDAIHELAAYAWRANQHTQNIGARRLYTIMERLVEDLSFEASDIGPAEITIDAEYVRSRLETIIQNEDLSKYIL